MSRQVVTVREEEDLGILRSTIKNVAVDICMSPVNQTKLMTAASELGQNMLRYGGGGEAVVDIRQAAGRRGIQLIFTDEGPGIADLSKALEEGYSSGRGMGIGLPGSQRLVDEFHIESVVGKGTTVFVTKWQV